MKTFNHIFLLLFVVLSLPVIAQPINDNPCSAIALSVGASCTFTQYTNLNATASAGVPAPVCGNYLGGDVWFSAVVPSSGSIIFDTNTGVITDGSMALYSGTCSALTLISCDEDGSANGLMPSISQTGLTPGTTVFVRFWEYGNDNNGTFSICAKAGIPCTSQGTNSTCAMANAICTDVSYNYCNTTSVPSLGGGGIYGCLLSTPNPTFYYLNVATSGPIIFNISQHTSGGVGIDVDFIIWGPFASQASMCAGLSAGNIIDCSYSTSSVETATIPATITGQWYMVLITNFSNQTGVINFTQTNSGTAGAGATNCNILNAIPSACAGGFYTVSGNVIVPSPPSSGTLTITNSCGGSVVLNAPFTSPIQYSISAPVCGNGNNCTVTAIFTAVGAPNVLPTTYDAPSCNTLTAIAGACVSGEYVLSGTLTTGCLPTTGTLTITSSCGGSIVVNAPFTSPYNWSLPPSNGNGGSCTVSAVYSATNAPIITPFVFYEPACCQANAGTNTVTQTNGTQTTLSNGTIQVVLCLGGSVNIVSNNDYTLPPPFPGETSELFYAVYTENGPSGNDPNLDSNWTGYYWTGQDFTTANGGGYNVNSSGGCSPLLGLPPVGAPYSSPNSPLNTLVFVPVTADDGDGGLNPNGVFNIDQDGDGCYDLGNPILITFLNPVSFNPIFNCSGTVTVEITGGYPQFFPAFYTLTNTGSGTLNSNLVTSGGNAVISGLTAGQTYSFSVNDGNGCISTFSGIYSGLPVISIVPSTATICNGGCVPLTGNISSGVGNGSLTYTSNQCSQIPDGGIGAANGTPLVVGGSWAHTSINVSGVCDQTWETGNPLIICMNINHTYDGDLDIYIQAPNGVYYLLSNDNGGAGDNYTGTCFSATAVSVIPSAASNAPYSGSYKPQGAGNNFSGLNGTPINGTWTLWVSDDLAGDIGTLINWSITLGNQNTFTYAWSPITGLSSSTSLTPTACPTTSTTYTLTATNSCGCTAYATSAITVGGGLTINVPPATICNGNSTLLNASGATTYSWSPSTGLSATTGATVTANPTITTTYTIIGTTVSGCSNSTTSVVTVNSNTATITPNGPTTFCGAGSVVLTASTGISYQWYKNNVLINGATNQNYTATTTASYTVVINTACGFVTSLATQVIKYPLPTVTISAAGSTTFCSGNSVTINSTVSPSTVTYQWYKSSTAISGATNSSYTANSTGLYAVIVTNTVNGCTKTSSQIQVTVNPAPTIIASPISICNGVAGTLTATGATTYTWSPSLGLSATTGAIVTANPSVTSTYTVTGIASTGCTGSTTVVVTISGLPVININPISICNGSTGTLTASGATTYTWSPSTGLNVTTGSSVMANPTITTTYTVNGISSASCSGTTSVIVTVNNKPTISASAIAICSGQSGTLTASGASTYTWAPSTGLNATTGASVLANPSTTTTYTVTGTNINGCTNFKTVKVTVRPLPSASITPTGSATICDGDTLTLFALTNTGIQYQWKKNGINISGATNSTYDAMVAGGYRVLITNTYGCQRQSAQKTITTVVCRIGELENNSADEINLYPNPTDGILKISSSIEIDKIECFNSLGQLVFQKGYESEIDLSNYAAGNYLIKLDYKNGKEYKVYKIELAK